jgi:hypothetical protein
MIARLDALVIALSVAGGSMLIENNHRLDTGAPDEGLVAAPPTTLCQPDRYILNRQTTLDVVFGPEAGESEDATDTTVDCSTD